MTKTADPPPEPSPEPGYPLLAHVARARRHRLRMSQQDVAEAGGPSFSSVQNIERGDGPFTRRTCLKVDTALAWPARTAECLLRANNPKAVDNWGDFVSISINDLDAHENETISEWVDAHTIYSTAAQIQQLNTYLSSADYHLVCLKESATPEQLQRIQIIEQSIHGARSTVFQWFSSTTPDEEGI